MNVNHENGDKQEDGRFGSALDLPPDIPGMLSMNLFLREENGQLKERLKELKALAEDLEKENGWLKDDKSSTEGEIARLSEALKSLEATAEELATVNRSLSSAVEELGIQNEKLSSAEEQLAMENDNLSSRVEENKMNKKAMGTMASELSKVRSLGQRVAMDLQAERAYVASLREEIQKLNERSVLPSSAIRYVAAASSGAFATVGLLLLYRILRRSK